MQEAASPQMRAAGLRPRNTTGRRLTLPFLTRSKRAAIPGHHRQGRCAATTTISGGITARASDPYEVLGVEPGASKADVRTAYLQRIRQLHPDVNPSEDATQQATGLNAAYEAVLADLGTSRSSVDEEELGDVFDRCRGPPDRPFINPFACYGVSPLEWEALQQVALGEDGSGDPEQALLAAGLSSSGNALVYLTEEQLQAVRAELEAMCAMWAFDATSYYIADCLGRARVANNRTEVQRQRRRG